MEVIVANSRGSQEPMYSLEPTNSSSHRGTTVTTLSGATCMISIMEAKEISTPQH